MKAEQKRTTFDRKKVKQANKPKTEKGHIIFIHSKSERKLNYYHGLGFPSQQIKKALLF